jgi:hypothetical protein
MRVLALSSLVFGLAACGSPSNNNGLNPDANDHPGDGHGSGSGYQDAPVVVSGRTVFVIPLENKPAAGIYGNMTNAPYINGLMATAAYATKFADELPALDSEPHYIWMEAGTNVFTDRSFTTDNDSSSSNSTASTDHLTAQLNAANVPWMSYQEDITAGTCPIASTAEFAAKHDPFVFFQDIAGSPPSASNAGCIAHHKPYSQFAADLANGITGFVWITPNLCHDMHGDVFCPSFLGTDQNILAGDTWLSTELPRIIAYTQTHDAVIFLEWDEGDATNLVPFLAIGHGVKPGQSQVDYTHSSLLKSTEKLLGVPVLSAASSANDFSAMFQSPL